MMEVGELGFKKNFLVDRLSLLRLAPFSFFELPSEPNLSFSSTYDTRVSKV